MSDSEADSYEYESYGEEVDAEDRDAEDAGGKSEKVPAVPSSASLSAATSATFKKILTSCADGEVRLLHMSDIVGAMQSKIAQISDLFDIPAASAAALLRHMNWSQEKLTDQFWADAEKVLSEAGVSMWKKSAQISTIGTLELDSAAANASVSPHASAAGTQEGAEMSGAQTRPFASTSGIALGLPPGYCGIAMRSASELEESTVTCRICFLEVDVHDSALASPCGHFFCGECYHEYLATKLGDGPACVFATCPEHKCRCLVPPEIWVRALENDGTSCQTPGKQSDEVPGATVGGGGGSGAGGAKSETALLRKYSKIILDQFVSITKVLRWCPAPGCERIIMAGAGVVNVRCGPGGCGANFCFRCGEEAHAPSSCSELVLWTEKCQNESETANWILANTKRCPKCTTRIEKNQGCNHMTCSQCKYEFCWTCMGNWTDHGANTGGYYKCNKFDPAASTDPDDATGRAKRELDRYLHYFKRYQAHHSAQLFAEKQLLQTERRMGELQETTGGSSWIDVQFLKTANEMVIECRRTLKFTYVFGYYLTAPKPLASDESNKHRDLFENMQEDLERYTELLSELTEYPIEKMCQPEVKESIINNTRVVEKFQKNLLEGCDEGLDEVGKSITQGLAAAEEPKPAASKASGKKKASK
jgi:ariadne-1